MRTKPLFVDYIVATLLSKIKIESQLLSGNIKKGGKKPGVFCGREQGEITLFSFEITTHLFAFSAESEDSAGTILILPPLTKKLANLSEYSPTWLV